MNQRAIFNKYWLVYLGGIIGFSILIYPLLNTCADTHRTYLTESLCSLAFSIRYLEYLAFALGGSFLAGMIYAIKYKRKDIIHSCILFLGLIVGFVVSVVLLDI